MKKLIGLLLMIILFILIFLTYFEGTSNAAYSDKFANYPGYKELIDALQKAHPNWEFEILETGLDWAASVKEESKHRRSLIQSSKTGPWRCSCNEEYEPNWYCASSAAVAYYLDPRNSLNEEFIFQFEKLTYNSDLQTKEGVEYILRDCNYMQGKITYYDTKGKKQTINKTYADVILETAKMYNVSAYHLAARIRQEQGTGNGGSMISGKYSGFVGYYNHFNCSAFGSTTSLILKNGLTYAKNQGWTDPEKAIKGGAKLVAKEYIGIGQNTLYLEKFDVVDGGNGYYWNQYMTNVSASKTEGATVKATYQKLGLLNKKVVFRIPVYKNMPTYACPEPGKETIVTQDVQTNGEVNIRKGKGVDQETITTLKKGVKLLRIEYAQKKEKGYYWDKVVLADGRVGYAIRDRLNNLSLQSNCNEKDIVLNNIEVRNGPGKTSTAVVNYIAPGNLVTVVEKGKYPNLNGENWYRVRLSDNTYGYIAVGAQNNPNITKYDEDSPDYDYVEVICTDGLRIRREPTTTKNNVITAVAKGTQLFRAQKSASNAEGYIWDKVVTSNGTIGYCVRQDKNNGEAWIKSLSKKKYEVDDKNANIICVPDVTPEKLQSLSAKIVVKNGDKEIAKDAKIGTGYTITVDGKTYTAVVKGDVNGDGKVDSSDYVRIKNHLRKKETMSATEQLGADVTGEGNVTSSDYVKIKNYLRKKEDITIN